jgi:hypothetical protein
VISTVVGEPAAVLQRILSSPTPRLAKVRFNANSFVLLDFLYSRTYDVLKPHFSCLCSMQHNIFNKIMCNPPFNITVVED